jgi:hypothetical protein
MKNNPHDEVAQFCKKPCILRVLQKKRKKLRKQFAWSSSPMFRCNVLNHVRGFNPRTSPAGAMSLTTGKPSSIGKKELTL